MGEEVLSSQHSDSLAYNDDAISLTINRFDATLAAIWLAIVGIVGILFMPLAVGAFVDVLGFTKQQAGNIVSAESAGLALVSVSSIFWVRMGSWRTIALLALLVFIAINVLTVWIADYYLMMLVRFVSGCSGAVLISIGVACQSDNKKADAVFGYFIGLELTVASIGFFFIPSAIQSFGIGGIMLTLAGLGVSGLLTLLYLPNRGRDRSNTTSPVKTSLWVSLLALFGALCFYTSQGGFYAFVERMAMASALEPIAIGRILGMSLYAGIAGALLATWFAKRLGWVLSFVLLLVGEVACVAMLYGSFGYWEFTVSQFVFEFCWSMGIPLLMSLFNRLDSSGRLVLLLFASGKFGYAIGPALTGTFIVGDDYTYALSLIIGICSAGIVICMALAHKCIRH